MPRCGSGFSGGHSRGALARDLLPMAALATVQLDAADGLRRLPACGPAAHGMVSPPAASFAASPARGRRVCTPGRPSIPLISGPLKKNGVREAGRRRAQKRVSYLHRTATTTYPCSIPRLGDSAGAGRVRLTRDAKVGIFSYLCKKIGEMRKKTLLRIFLACVVLGAAARRAADRAVQGQRRRAGVRTLRQPHGHVRSADRFAACRRSVAMPPSGPMPGGFAWPTASNRATTCCVPA